MGALQRLNAVIMPARMRASVGNPADPFYGLYGAYLPPEGYGGVGGGGAVPVYFPEIVYLNHAAQSPQMAWMMPCQVILNTGMSPASVAAVNIPKTAMLTIIGLRVRDTSPKGRLSG